MPAQAISSPQSTKTYVTQQHAPQPWQRRWLPPMSTRMVLGQNALAPFGHVRFCAINVTECTSSDGEISITITGENWRQLNRVNLATNRAIRPAYDGVVNGLDDSWTLRPAAGDCEDYALTKRSQLIKMGWPSGALSIATVEAPGVGHHAVLVVRTDRGDYVLDNLQRKILPWQRVGYVWIKIQSTGNPRRWFTI